MSGKPVISRKKGTGITLKDFLGLVKAHLSLYIALAAAAGHALAGSRFGVNSLILGGWVFLLAAGAGVLNNIQDRKLDRKRVRTRNRVLARGALPAVLAWIATLGLTGTAVAGLYFSYPGQVRPVFWGILSLICYNALYTPIKKISLWAMVPGTLCGMIPPALGWSTVPPDVASTDISGLIILMACLGIWQFPHYLLVELTQPIATPVLSPLESGHHECISFKQLWPEQDIHCLILIWTILFSMGMVLFAAKGWVADIRLFTLLLVLAFFLPALMLFFWVYPGVKKTKAGFWIMNLSMLGFLCIIVLDRLPA